MCLSVPFLIILRAPNITGTVVVLRWHIFEKLLLGLCIHSFFYILWLICYYQSVLTYVKNVASNIEQVLAATPHKAPTIGQLPPITKTIQARRTRHAGHCWRSKDEIVSDVLLWTPAYGQSKAGRPARTYIQQLCDDTGCNPEDLPEAMNDRETWGERVRDICASRTTWWWW